MISFYVLLNLIPFSYGLLYFETFTECHLSYFAGLYIHRQVTVKLSLISVRNHILPNCALYDT